MNMMSKAKEKIKNINRVYILGDCAGAGKTYMATKLNDRTLFVSPYNSQCQEIQLMGLSHLHSINYLVCISEMSTKTQFG